MLGSTSQLAMYTMGSLLFFSLLRIEIYGREGGGELAGVDERRLSKRGGLQGLLGGLRLFQIAPGMGGWVGGGPKVFSVEILGGHRRKNTKGGKTLYQPTFL